MSSGHRIATFLVLCCAAHAFVWAQSDDWFRDKRHDKWNRWEGLFGDDQSSPDWELRSFVGGVEGYPSDASVNLKIKYYVPDESSAFIRAQTIDDTVAYLMKPKPAYLRTGAGWREFDGWPTREVILPSKIDASNLGVLIRLGIDSEAVRRLAPAVVYHSAHPPMTQGYRLAFFSLRELLPFSFTVIGEKSYVRRYHNEGAGARSTVLISFDARTIPEGQTRIILRARHADQPNVPLAFEVDFYHKR